MFGDGTHLDIENSQALTRTWTFGNNTVVHGHGTQLDLENYSINALPASSLRLNNLEIAGLKSHNLRCHDATAKLIIENCALGMSQNFSFTSGSITLQQEAHITGTSKFSYQTNQPLIS